MKKIDIEILKASRVIKRNAEYAKNCYPNVMYSQDKLNDLATKYYKSKHLDCQNRQ